MKTIVNGLAIEYEDQGNGPVALLLHGWKDSLRTFDLIVPVLAESMRVVRLDLPGFGQSEPPPAAWGVGDYLGLVQSFVAKLNLNVALLVGHSFGGRIALKALGSNAIVARGTVLVASAGLRTHTSFRRSSLKLVAKVGKLATLVPPFSWFRQQLRRKLYGSIGSDYFAAGAMGRTYLKVVAEDLSAAAARVAVPTLLLWGDQDTETPLADGRRLAQLIERSRLVVFPGAGHFVHRERPAEVARDIGGFSAGLQ